MIAAAFLILLGVYLACGLLFAVAFVLLLVKRLDPNAAYGSWGFRLLMVPGVIALWPVLLRRWVSGIHQPPQERNAHRLATRGVTR